MLTNLLSAETMAWFEKSAASELYASNLYRYLANRMQAIGLFGAQSFFLKEAESEAQHFKKLSDFVNDMGGILGVPAVEKIEEDAGALQLALMIAYETELDLMRQYQEFYEYAEDKAKDCITATFIIEFMQIQRQSVGEYGDLINRLARVGDIYAFDNEMKNM